MRFKRETEYDEFKRSLRDVSQAIGSRIFHLYA